MVGPERIINSDLPPKELSVPSDKPESLVPSLSSSSFVIEGNDIVAVNDLRSAVTVTDVPPKMPTDDVSTSKSLSTDKNNKENETEPVGTVAESKTVPEGQVSSSSTLLSSSSFCEEVVVELSDSVGGAAGADTVHRVSPLGGVTSSSSLSPTRPNEGDNDKEMEEGNDNQKTSSSSKSKSSALRSPPKSTGGGKEGQEKGLRFRRKRMRKLAKRKKGLRGDATEDFDNIDENAVVDDYKDGIYRQPRVRPNPPIPPRERDGGMPATRGWKPMLETVLSWPRLPPNLTRSPSKLSKSGSVGGRDGVGREALEEDVEAEEHVSVKEGDEDEYHDYDGGHRVRFAFHHDHFKLPEEHHNKHIGGGIYEPPIHDQQRRYSSGVRTIEHVDDIESHNQSSTLAAAAAAAAAFGSIDDDHSNSTGSSIASFRLKSRPKGSRFVTNTKWIELADSSVKIGMNASNSGDPQKALRCYKQSLRLRQNVTFLDDLGGIGAGPGAGMYNIRHRNRGLNILRRLNDQDDNFNVQSIETMLADLEARNEVDEDLGLYDDDDDDEDEPPPMRMKPLPPTPPPQRKFSPLEHDASNDDIVNKNNDSTGSKGKNSERRRDDANYNGRDVPVMDADNRSHQFLDSQSEHSDQNKIKKNEANLGGEKELDAKEDKNEDNKKAVIEKDTQNLTIEEEILPAASSSAPSLPFLPRPHLTEENASPSPSGSTRSVGNEQPRHSPERHSIHCLPLPIIRDKSPTPLQHSGRIDHSSEISASGDTNSNKDLAASATSLSTPIPSIPTITSSPAPFGSDIVVVSPSPKRKISKLPASFQTDAFSNDAFNTRRSGTTTASGDKPKEIQDHKHSVHDENDSSDKTTSQHNPSTMGDDDGNIVHSSSASLNTNTTTTASGSSYSLPPGYQVDSCASYSPSGSYSLPRGYGFGSNIESQSTSTSETERTQEEAGGSNSRRRDVSNPRKTTSKSSPNQTTPAEDQDQQRRRHRRRDNHNLGTDLNNHNQLRKRPEIVFVRQMSGLVSVMSSMFNSVHDDDDDDNGDNDIENEYKNDERIGAMDTRKVNASTELEKMASASAAVAVAKSLIKRNNRASSREKENTDDGLVNAGINILKEDEAYISGISDDDTRSGQQKQQRKTEVPEPETGMVDQKEEEAKEVKSLSLEKETNSEDTNTSCMEMEMEMEIRARRRRHDIDQLVVSTLSKSDFMGWNQGGDRNLSLTVDSVTDKGDSSDFVPTQQQQQRQRQPWNTYETGLVHYSNNELSEASACFEQALRHSMKTLGIDHVITNLIRERLADSMMALGNVSAGHDHYYIALRHFRKILEKKASVEEAKGKDDDFKVIMLSNDNGHFSPKDINEHISRIRRSLGDLHFAAGNFERALKFYDHGETKGKKTDSTYPSSLRSNQSNTVVFGSTKKTIDAHKALASCSLQKEDYDLALFHFREVLWLLRLIPTSARNCDDDKEHNKEGDPVDENDNNQGYPVSPQPSQTKQSVEDFNYASEAIESLQKRGEDVTDDLILMVLDNVAAVHIERKQFDSAIKCFEDKLNFVKLHTTADWSRVAGVLWQLGHICSGIAFHKRAIEHLKEYLTLVEEKKFDQNYEGGIGAQDAVASSLKWLGLSYLSTGNHILALNTFEEYLQICSVEYAVVILFAMGIIYSKMYNFTKAFDCLGGALELDITYREGTESDSGVSYLVRKLREIFFFPRKFPKAARSYVKILDIKDIKRILQHLGWAQLRKETHRANSDGFLQELIEQLFEGGTHTTGTGRLFQSMGNVLLRRCRYRESIVYYEKFLKEVGEVESILDTWEQFEFFTNIGTAYQKVGLPDKARASCKKARDVLLVARKNSTTGSDPNITITQEQLQHLIKKNQMESNHDGEHKSRHLSGLVSCLEGKYENAIGVLDSSIQEKCATNGFDHPNIGFLYADKSNIHFLRGETEEAHESFDTALELFHDDDEEEGFLKPHPFMDRDQFQRLFQWYNASVVE